MTNGASTVISAKTLIPFGVVCSIAAVAFTGGAHYEKVTAQETRLKAIEEQKIPDQLSSIRTHLAVIEQHLGIRIPARADAASDTATTSVPRLIRQSRPRRAVAIDAGN